MIATAILQKVYLTKYLFVIPGISIEDIDYGKYPSKDFQMSWIREYLTEFANSKPSQQDIERVYNEGQLLTLASHFLWGIWSLVQFEHSDINFDFGR